MLEFIEMSPFADDMIRSYDVFADDTRLGMVIQNGEGVGFLANSSVDIICKNYINQIVGFMNELGKS